MTSHPSRWLVGAGCAVALALIAASIGGETRLETSAHVGGSDAERVEQELAEQFHSEFVHRAILVIRGIPAPDTEAGARALADITAALRKDAGVSGTISYLDWTDPLFLGSNGGTFLMLGLSGSNAAVDAAIPRLRDDAQRLRAELRGRYPALEFELTGEAPLNFDLRRISSDDVHRAEIQAIPLVLVLLVAAFGSLAASIVPLTVGYLAMLMTLGAASLLARWWHLSILIQNIATMMGLGLGIDYALLMLSRFREATAGGEDAAHASGTAGHHAGRALLVSAATVAIGFCALLLVPISDVRSIGLAGCLVAGSTVLLANLILPAVLARLGKRLDAGRLPALAWASADSRLSRERWRAWTRVVTARPWLALVLAAAPLALLASQAPRLTPGLPRIDWLPAAAESVRGLHSLADMHRVQIAQSLRLILTLPAGAEAQTYAGWNAIRQLAAEITGDKRADRVISLPSLLGRGMGPSFLPLMPAATRQAFVRGDGRATVLEVVPGPALSTSDQGVWVRELRRLDVAAITGVPGAALQVGGLAAFNEDYDAVIRQRLPLVAALVLGGTLLTLLLGFRSVVVAIKAIALNLLSVGASFGALVLAFQDGLGGRWLGLTGGTGEVFSIVPIVSFAIVFGLSMDYEVFLVARVLEARRGGLSEIEAIVEGVARTGGLITSAAAIMIVVFVAFACGHVLVIKMLGFTLATAVLIDATLVRMVIGPALLSLGGDWNWWPGGLAGAAALGRR